MSVTLSLKEENSWKRSVQPLPALESRGSFWEQNNKEEVGVMMEEGKGETVLTSPFSESCQRTKIITKCSPFLPSIWDKVLVSKTRQVLIDYTIIFPGLLVFSICCSFHLSVLKNTFKICLKEQNNQVLIFPSVGHPWTFSSISKSVKFIFSLYTSVF